MKAPTTRSKPAQRRRALRRRWGRGGGCVWCSCGHLPTEHAQRVRLDFFFVLDYRQPVSIFVHRSVALRALPDDLQSPVLYFEAAAQISSGNANIAVRDIAFRAGRACGAASNGSAKTVPVWLSCGLHAGCATEGGDHVATCSCVLQLSANNSGRAALKYCKRYPGMPFLRHWDTAPVVTSHISATFDVPPSRSMRFSSFMLAILDD